MPISVKDLQRIGSFTFSTKELGEIKIWAFTAGAAARLTQGAIRNEFKSSIEKVRLLIRLIGTRLNTDDENERGKKLTTRELRKLSENELDRLAETFLEKHPYLYSRDSEVRQFATPVNFETVDFPKRPEESYSQYLDRTLEEYNQRSFTSLFGAISSGLASQFKANSDLSSRVKTLLGEVKVPAKSLNPTIPPGVIRSPLHRMDEMVDTINSLAELNRESVLLVTSLNDLGRDMGIEFAQNAKRSTRLTYVAIVIAVLSLVITTIFSVLNYVQTKDSLNNNRPPVQNTESSSTSGPPLPSDSAMSFLNRKRLVI